MKITWPLDIIPLHIWMGVLGTDHEDLEEHPCLSCLTGTFTKYLHLVTYLIGWLSSIENFPQWMAFYLFICFCLKCKVCAKYFDYFLLIWLLKAQEEMGLNRFIT